MHTRLFCSHIFAKPSIFIFRMLFVLFILSFALSSYVMARPLEAVQQTGSLRVTVYRNYKPFSWIENGRFRGIDVDIAAKISEMLHVKVDYFALRDDDNIDDDLRNGVWKGTIFGEAPGDIMMHVPYDKKIEEKNDLVHLFSPYFVDRLAMAVNPDQAGQAADFSLYLHEKVGVDVGSLADMILVSVLDKQLVPHVVHFRGTERAAEAYNHGEIAGFYGESATVESLTKQITRPVKIIYPEVPRQKPWIVGLAVKTNSINLADKVETIMQDLQKSGELSRIFMDYGVHLQTP